MTENDVNVENGWNFPLSSKLKFQISSISTILEIEHEKFKYKVNVVKTISSNNNHDCCTGVSGIRASAKCLN